MKKFTKGILLGAGVSCGIAIISGIALAIKKSLTGFTDEELDLDLDEDDEQDLINNEDNIFSGTSLKEGDDIFSGAKFFSSKKTNSIFDDDEYEYNDLDFDEDDIDDSYFSDEEDDYSDFEEGD